MIGFLNVIGWFVLIVGVTLWVAILTTGLSNLRKLQRPAGDRALAARPAPSKPTEQTGSDESPFDSKTQ